MSDLKPRGFARVGFLEDNRNIKSLENSSGNSVTMGVGIPSQGDGKVGDITVRFVHSLGHRMYVKTHSGWLDINSMTRPEKVIWHDMKLATGMSIAEDVSSNPRVTPQYALDHLGFIHLRGAIDIAGGTSAIADITTLPSGYRPTKDIFVPGSIGAGTAALVFKITSGGVINAPGNAAKTDISFDGVSFFAWRDSSISGGGGGGGTPDTGAGGDEPR